MLEVEVRQRQVINHLLLQQQLLLQHADHPYGLASFQH
jgi:hypothetical protein